MATDVDVLSLIPAAHKPVSFGLLSDAERAVRGRYFLMAYAMGASIEYAWFNAMDASPEHSREMRTIVAGVEDAEIEQALATRDRPERPVLDWEPTT